MNTLYAVVLHFRAAHAATIPATMGHQTHAAFLALIATLDSALAARLHDAPNYRPFTVGPVVGGVHGGDQIGVAAGAPATVRVTLLDDGILWQTLVRGVLQVPPPILQISGLGLILERLSPITTTWAALAETPPHPTITLRFSSPTAFHLGNKAFHCFPDPKLVFESLARSWNLYAPMERTPLDKAAIGCWAAVAIRVTAAAIRSVTLHYPQYRQPGFVGTCTYQVPTHPHAAIVAQLAAFAPYAGVGGKTTQGMGQIAWVAPLYPRKEVIDAVPLTR